MSMSLQQAVIRFNAVAAAAAAAVNEDGDDDDVDSCE